MRALCVLRCRVAVAGLLAAFAAAAPGDSSALPAARNEATDATRCGGSPFRYGMMAGAERTGTERGPADHEAALTEIACAAAPGADCVDLGTSAGAGRDTALGNGGAAIARHDPDHALALARRLEPGADRDRYLLGVFAELARSEPLRAATELRAGMDGTIGDTVRLAQEVFAQWSGRDPAAAGAFLATLPPGQARNVAMEVVLAHWVAANAQAALAWAAALPEGPGGLGDVMPVGIAGRVSLENVHFGRRHALQVVAFHWARTDPQAANAWARTLSDDGLRHAIVELMRHAP